MSRRDTFSNQTGRGNANRNSVSKAMKRNVRHCRECGRGQNPRWEYEHGLDARPWWKCRYCDLIHDSDGTRR